MEPDGDRRLDANPRARIDEYGAYGKTSIRVSARIRISFYHPQYGGGSATAEFTDRTLEHNFTLCQREVALPGQLPLIRGTIRRGVAATESS